MTLSIGQMALMSRLLDQALPLDAAGRRLWLESLSPEHQELAQYLREALLPGEAEAGEIASLATLPKFGSAQPAEAAASGLNAGARVGPYELIRLLGAGGMAEVWLARRADGAFKREVALKLPMLSRQRADLEQRFAQERDILASLEHPHIARLYDAGVDSNGLPYLSMEFVRGQPLTAWCDARHLGITARLELFLQVLEAVQYAHGKQVIHRDLKPSNILVTEPGEVRLLDFGVAKLLAADEEDPTPLTSIHGRALTPDYASPELLRGDTIDARTDIYSLGVLLYEMLTGVRPYQLKSAASLGLLDRAIATIDVKKPSTQHEPGAVAARDTTPEKLARQLRGDLDAVILKALAKGPEERYPGTGALARDLRCYLAGKPVEALPPRLTDRVRKFLRRNRLMVVGAAAVAAATLVAGFLVFGPQRQMPDRDWRDPLAEARVTRLTDLSGSEQAGAISRDGRFVAFLADRDGHQDAWLTEIGSNSYRNLTNGHFHEMGNAGLRTVGFSPDGALVTIWTRTGGGSRPEDITIVGAPVAGGALQIYMREGSEYDWSPDGKHLVYHSTAPGDPMFVRTVGETAAHQIYVAPPGTHCHFPTWSPDGEFIYFVRGEPPAQWDVWRLHPSGADPERMTFHNARVGYPVLLDPRTLLYLATDADGSGPWLYVMDVPHRRAHRASVGLERYTSLAASANGRRLVATVGNTRSNLWRVAVLSGEPPQSAAVPVAPSLQNAFAPRFGTGYIAYVSTSGGRRGIWKLANGAVTQLWDDAGADRLSAPAIAPDGRSVAFTVTRRDVTQLYVVDSDGRQARVISSSLTLRGDLAWSPDSRSIVAAIVRDGEPRLARILLDGSPPQPIVAEYSVDAAWSPDGKYFVYSGADVGTTFPLRASGPDGRPYDMPSMILTRGARRVAFARNSGSLVILRGEIGHKNFWLLDPHSGAERQLTDLPSNFVIGDFDVSPDGKEIVFDRSEDSSNIALIERAS
jgi:serine/threonine protein kinase/Tol biopolymer transport system component